MQGGEADRPGWGIRIRGGHPVFNLLEEDRNRLSTADARQFRYADPRENRESQSPNEQNHMALQLFFLLLPLHRGNNERLGNLVYAERAAGIAIRGGPQLDPVLGRPDRGARFPGACDGAVRRAALRFHLPGPLYRAGVGLLAGPAFLGLSHRRGIPGVVPRTHVSKRHNHGREATATAFAR